MSKQRTISKSVSLKGVGIHSGNEVNLTFKPAKENYGYCFCRTDLPEKPIIEANIKYVDKNGNMSGYPWNPNGSSDNIAGVCDSTGRILGMMPHPERHIDPTQHPRWTREGLKAEGDGIVIFRNAVNYISRTFSS